MKDEDKNETKTCKNCGESFEAWLDAEKLCLRCKATWQGRPRAPSHGMIIKKRLPE